MSSENLIDISKNDFDTEITKAELEKQLEFSIRLKHGLYPDNTLKYHFKNPDVIENMILKAIELKSIGLLKPSKFRLCVGHHFLPLTGPISQIGFNDKIFCGKFSLSGEVFLSACQNATINLFTSDALYKYALKDKPLCQNRHTSRFRRYHSVDENQAVVPYKSIECRDVGWAVVGVDFSSDDKWLAYSSWSPYVHLCNVKGPYEMHEALDFFSHRGVRDSANCLFSITFSPLNTHILAGSNKMCVHLYNLERKETEMILKAHKDDVNAVCYLDESGNVFASGSDDCLIKIWDLRSGCSSPMGSLIGHADGITCIAAKMDGRTLASNSKDQSLKVWDTRAMIPPNSFHNKIRVTALNWDYRSSLTRPRNMGISEYDVSLKTFSGHRVLQTLIRCAFSPAHTTGQRYVYSGSQCGKIFAWDILTGEQLSINDSVRIGHDHLVRDVSWHPYYHLIASSSWDHSVGLWTYKNEKHSFL